MASANRLMKEMQQIAANAQVQVQKLANQATEKSFQYNTKEANTARQWQTEMSNTAHQREVKDLIKAGLNPVLATNNGAQSYTTSSASAQANDPSGSIGNLAGNLIQSRTNAYQADTSAAATRAAAASSAAATRYAANMNLRAAQAAAYASMYSADKHLEGQKYSTDNSKSGTIPGIASNAAKATKADNVGLLTNMKSTYKDMAKNPNKYVKNNVDNPKSVFDLTASGRNVVQKTLRNMGIKETLPNQNIVFNALYKGNKASINQMNAWINAYKIRMKKVNTFWSARSGSGIW